MNSRKTNKIRPTGPISTGIILLAILALLLMQGQAQAWSTTIKFLIWRGGW